MWASQAHCCPHLPHEWPPALPGWGLLQGKSHLLFTPGSPGQAWLRAGAWHWLSELVTR